MAKGVVIVSQSNGSPKIVGANVKEYNGNRILKRRNIRDRKTKVDMTRSINRMKEENRRAIYNAMNG
ncbi:hypothetical protein JMA_44350 (plasmid) [Jeotgalibacillus malaysiensis]|uniref:Uncharacterized protein n=1 Tax=Jeotgalibacillus malaysiensis TaxID=1508404 RepID=A0A0B5AYL0_9BACL|nr:hypothetical protein [Jeotgalibacillus malaysiensis]AJD93752.1 hypothetical protein JMA_44350 [Jeotgalibacillus malaysiensis]